MVKILSQSNQDRIAKAVEDAERATSAEIIFVITPASSIHADFLLFYALLVSYAVGVSLFVERVLRSYLELSLIQVAIIAVIFFTPFLRRLCWRLMPRRVLHRRSAAKALQEYSQIHRKSPANLPIVFLYISLGERYAHIIPNRAVYDRIADDHWNGVIKSLTKLMRSKGVTPACEEAARQIGNVLAQFFPEEGKANNLSDNVIIANL